MSCGGLTVLSTDCRPMLDYARRLSGSLGCRFFDHPSRGGPLAEQIVRHEAHFAVVTDGNAETCSVVDESGKIRGIFTKDI